MAKTPQGEVAESIGCAAIFIVAIIAYVILTLNGF